MIQTGMEFERPDAKKMRPSKCPKGEASDQHGGAVRMLRRCLIPPLLIALLMTYRIRPVRGLYFPWIEKRVPSITRPIQYQSLVRFPSSTFRAHQLSQQHKYSRDLLKRPLSTVDVSEEVYAELQRLSDEIRRHDQLYYEESPEISDDDYDALVRREEEICKQYPDLLEQWQEQSGLGIQATRYGGRVGSNLQMTTTTTSSRFIKRKHLRPMLSLDNVNYTDQLLAWLERIRKKLLGTTTSTVDHNNTNVTIITEPKLDGLSLSVRYERQKDGSLALLWASTRGDSKQGQDVTVAIQEGSIVPRTIKWDNAPEIVEIRGEIVLPTTVFESLDDNNLTFSNARNAASGIILRKEQQNDLESKQIREKLRFYAYDIVAEDMAVDGAEARATLPKLGFDVPEPSATTLLTVNNETAWNESDIQPMLDYHNALQRHRDGESESSSSSEWWGDYEMDGCVHKVSQHSLRMALGTSNRAPRWAIAHKFPPLSAVTALLDIEVQVGRTGALTPVAVLQPVELGGVTVQRATMHNFAHMRQMLGQVDRVPKGSLVVVRRAGDVIPQVVQRVDKGDSNEKDDFISLSTPDKCPACGSATVLETNTSASSDKGSVGQVLRCGGPQLGCPPRSVGALAHAFSRDALDLTGLSEARIQQLIEAGYLRIPSDLFTLTKDPEKLEKLAELKGWGPKSAQNLANVTKRVAAEGVTLTRFVYSLSIRYAGVHSSALIAAAYGTVDAFLDAVEQASRILEDTREDSSSTDTFAVLRKESDMTKGIGPVLLSSLERFSKEKEHVKAARELARSIKVYEDETYTPSVEIEDGTPSQERPLLGMRVVFTGALPKLSRSNAQKLAKEMGAKSTPNTISKATDLVVAGVKGGKKQSQATKLGVRVIEADEFMQIVNDFRGAAGNVT